MQRLGSLGNIDAFLTLSSPDIHINKRITRYVMFNQQVNILDVFSQIHINASIQIELIKLNSSRSQQHHHHHHHHKMKHSNLDRGRPRGRGRCLRLRAG